MKFAIITPKNNMRYHPFATVRKNVTSKLKEDGTLGDAAEAIEKQEPKDMTALEPKRTMSTIDVEGKDKDGNKIVDPIKDYERKEEQKGFDIKYNKEFEAWQKREREYEKGKVVAYATMWNDYTTQGMRDKVEQSPDYESKIKDNPIALIEIMSTISQNGDTNTYTYRALYMALKGATNTRMPWSEHHNDFMKRVRGSGDPITRIMGKEWLRPMLETQASAKWKKANKEGKEKMCHEVHEAFLAHAMLEGANNEKHGSFKDDPHQMANLGEEKHPKTTAAMNTAIGKHKWDKTQSEHEKEQKSKKATKKELQLAQTRVNGRKFICYCCGEEGHPATQCPKSETIAPIDWWIVKQNNKAAQAGKADAANETQHAQTEEHDEVEEDPNREQSVSCRRSSTSKRRSATPAPKKRCGGAFQMDE